MANMGPIWVLSAPGGPKTLVAGLRTMNTNKHITKPLCEYPSRLSETPNYTIVYDPGKIIFTFQRDMESNI